MRHFDSHYSSASPLPTQLWAAFECVLPDTPQCGEEAGESFSESHLVVGNKYIRSHPTSMTWRMDRTKWSNFPTLVSYSKSVSSLSHILCIIFLLTWEELEGSSEELSSLKSSSFCFVCENALGDPLPGSLTTTWTHKTNFLLQKPLTSSVDSCSSERCDVSPVRIHGFSPLPLLLPILYPFYIPCHRFVKCLFWRIREREFRVSSIFSVGSIIQDRGPRTGYKAAVSYILTDDLCQSGYSWAVLLSTVLIHVHSNKWTRSSWLTQWNKTTCQLGSGTLIILQIKNELIFFNNSQWLSIYYVPDFFNSNSISQLIVYH